MKKQLLIGFFLLDLENMSRLPKVSPTNRDNKFDKLEATVPLESFHTGFSLSVPMVLLRRLILLSIPKTYISRNEETTIKGFLTFRLRKYV